MNFLIIKTLKNTKSIVEIYHYNNFKKINKINNKKKL